MTPVLLDSNVVIALSIAEHEHHQRASRWFHDVTEAALCPITEGALMRFLVRTGVPARSVVALIRALHDDPRIRFIADDLSYKALDVDHVIGHRQVTDSYLAAFAASHNARLATLDVALHTTLPDSTVLIPELTPSSA